MSLSLLNYHRMLLMDPVRMKVWRQAIQDTVKPGHVVVDVGTGTGIFSFLASAAGACRVYSIEESPIVAVARELARGSHWADRIHILAESSTHVCLPEQADVVLGDVFGAFGLNGNMLATMIDARQRFLKPGGVLLPFAMELSCVPVELPDWRGKFVDAWRQDLTGIDLSPCRRRAVNSLHQWQIPPGAALAEPASLGRITLMEAVEPAWRSRTTFEISRPGSLHGIGGWCTYWLTPSIPVSNSPFEANRLVWSQGVFPVETPVEVESGDTVEVDLRFATHGPWMLWNWQVVVKSGAAIRGDFRHSTFQGALLSLEEICRQSPSFLPRASSRADVARAILELCDGSRSAGEIRDEIARRFADSFSTASQLSHFVANVIGSLCH